MGRIAFTKMVAAGNDFVLVDMRRASCVMRYAFIARKICDRKYGIGADGLLVLEKSRKADIKMRIFNADGSEAEMCGNGARCAAYFINAQRKAHNAKRTIETKAGIIDSKVSGEEVSIKLTDPKDIKLDIPLKINNRILRVNFINTGVPHTVIFAQGLEEIDIPRLGNMIRYHKYFAPRGTNVDFIEETAPDLIDIRTYERGVEDETLACGTGSVAAGLILALKNNIDRKVGVRTAGGEILNVFFARQGNKFSNVWLEGKARVIFKGEFNL